MGLAKAAITSSDVTHQQLSDCLPLRLNALTVRPTLALLPPVQPSVRHPTNYTAKIYKKTLLKKYHSI